MEFEYFAQHFTYDANTGTLYRRSSMCPCKTRDAKGYIVVGLNKKLYKVHRICYLLYYGSIDNNKCIDHINGTVDDNRIANLRCVHRWQNQLNQINPKKRRPNLGIVQRGKRWGAIIVYRGVRHWLGTYDDRETALQVRQQAEERFGFYK